MIKGKAVLFGLNYSHCKSGKLKGCINDVFNMAKYIHSILNMQIELYTDDTDLKNTSYDGIISKLHELAIESYRENLEFVWIHFSGHGSQQKDTSGDESDGYDEGIVPSDYEKKGILIDDIIHKIFCSFNPNTQILFVCDSCHSGSILDLKYIWEANKQCKIDNKNNSIKAKTMLISGCRDEQTSADAFNLLDDNKSVGALSASILKVLTKKPEKIYNAFSLINSVRNELKRGNFQQYPCLSTNYDISECCSLIPVSQKIQSAPVAPPLMQPTPQMQQIHLVQQPIRPQQIQPVQYAQSAQPMQPVQQMQHVQQTQSMQQTRPQQPHVLQVQPIAGQSLHQRIQQYNMQQPSTGNQAPQKYYYQQTNNQNQYSQQSPHMVFHSSQDIQNQGPNTRPQQYYYHATPSSQQNMSSQYNDMMSPRISSTKYYAY